ncbi:MAG: DMT family transporter [Candidatus Dormibacteraeota bacterium]|nr:DMT family transporter [Candidatus Dormibacteraeota bacterium]
MSGVHLTRRGLLLFASMSLIWGIPYFFIRIAVSELSPATLVFMRTTLAALVLLPFALARGGGFNRLWAKWPWLLAFAAVEMGIPWFLLSSAEQQISSSLTGLLISTVPLATTVVAIAFGQRERLSGASVGGLAIGMIGVAAIVGTDLHATSLLALAELAIVVIGYAVGPVILSRHLSDLSPVSVIAASLAVCAVAYAPIAAQQWPHVMPSTGVLLSVPALALACTAVAFLLFFALITEIGPVRSSVITYINPAVAALLGVFVLGETFTLGMAAGFVLVVCGAALATSRTTQFRRFRQLISRERTGPDVTG